MIPKNFDKFQEKNDAAEDPNYKGLKCCADCSCEEPMQPCEACKNRKRDFANDDWAGEPDYDLYDEY